MKKFSMFMSVGFAIVLAMVCIGCVSISEDLMVSPDPDNPFQGTWMHPSKNYLHTIEGMNGVFYASNGFSYTKQAVYTIEESDTGYITSNHWRIAVNDKILIVEQMTYERVVK